jgi:hypothetical protein
VIGRLEAEAQESARLDLLETEERNDAARGEQNVEYTAATEALGSHESGYARAVKEITSYLRDLSMGDAVRVVHTRFEIRGERDGD